MTRCQIETFLGRDNRFGRGARLYRHRSQLFGMLWVRLPLPTGQFSVIEFSFYNVVYELLDVKYRGAPSGGLGTVAEVDMS